MGHRVTVYNSHNHLYQQNEWRAVEIIHCFDAEHFFGTAGQFVYDLNCIRNARHKNFDVILFLGYTSSSVWGRIFPNKSVIISNMDGLEWKRTKYSKTVQQFLKYAERLAVKYSDYLIADSTAIQTYLDKKYHIQSKYIPYGAEMDVIADEMLLKEFGLGKFKYFMLMARMEPENNIDTVLDGFIKSNTENKFIVVGNYNNPFGHQMYKKYGNDKRVYFAGAIFDDTKITALRTFCALYFHGHSVGGTNPSLLEAMANGAFIAAHNNEFNRAILQNDTFYFSNSTDVLHIINLNRDSVDNATMVKNNLKKIEEQYAWPDIVNRYEKFIVDCYNKSSK